jgi:prophage regulatory protein
MTQATRPALRIIRRREVEYRTGLGRSALYERINPGSARFDPSFPKPVRRGNTSAVGWIEAEVDDWIARQVARRGAA